MSLVDKRKIIELNNERVVTEFFDMELFYNIKSIYEKIKNIKYVPEMKFYENKIELPYCGDCLNDLNNVNNKIKKIIKNQIIEFIRNIYELKIAHRDLHIKNICWKNNQIWIIDWEFALEYDINNIENHYDLTGEGLDSPYTSDNMNIFKKYNDFGLKTWLKPVSLNINDFYMRK
jgi:tRNA A-37 threonylcarbamoyl transferase component Bud32